MKRKLLKQICGEWRTNIWISIELLIVSIVVTVAVYAVYVNLRTYYMPMNIDMERTYEVVYSRIPPESESYDTIAAKIDWGTQQYNLLRAMRNHPIVEAAAMMPSYCMPYSRGSMSSYYRADTTKSEQIQVRLVDTSRDYPKVFHLKGINGETPEQLEQVLKDGKAIISRDLFAEQGIDAANLIGKKIYREWDEITVGAVIEPARWHEYDETGTRVIKQISDAAYGGLNIKLAVRIRPEFSGDVKETLMNEIHVGNYYIVGVDDMRDVRRIALLDKDNEVRNQIVIVAFLLFNLFLGILGTFWLRTFHRTCEIAIRKVNGASELSILRRLLSEGLVLVAVASVIAFPVDGLILKITAEDIFTWIDTLKCAAFTFVAISLMTMLGTLFPALKAMRVNPAEALKSE